MIEYELYCKIKHLHEVEGLKKKQIARNLDIDKRTVSKWLNQKNFTQKQIQNKASILDSYRGDIIRMLEEYQLSGYQIYLRIKETGYVGCYDTVKRYVRKVKPKRSPAFLKLTFLPGECAQVDWGSYGTVSVGTTNRRLSFFVMVLCYSRMMYLEFTVSQTMEFFLGCHENAFNFFGGVPESIMVDNLKSAVLKRPIGEPPIFNPKYLEFANHYGFKIKPCNVAKGNEKGRVENAVGYVKKNLLAGLEVTQFSQLKPLSHHWLDNVANCRIHGSTKEKPSDIFLKEKGILKSIPQNSFDIATISNVRASTQFRVTLDTNQYSVPAEYSGYRLTLKANPAWISIFHENNLISRHSRCFDRICDFEHPDHPKELIAYRKKAHQQRIFKRFLHISPEATRFFQLMEQKRLNPTHHVRKIVALTEIYSNQDIAQAIQSAIELDACSSEYIINILEQRAQKEDKPGELILTKGKELLEITVTAPDLNIYQSNFINKDMGAIDNE